VQLETGLIKGIHSVLAAPPSQLGSASSCCLSRPAARGSHCLHEGLLRSREIFYRNEYRSTNVSENLLVEKRSKSLYYCFKDVQSVTLSPPAILHLILRCGFRSEGLSIFGFLDFEFLLRPKIETDVQLVAPKVVPLKLDRRS
jgi:hypothetical protein